MKTMRLLTTFSLIATLSAASLGDEAFDRRFKEACEEVLRDTASRAERAAGFYRAALLAKGDGRMQVALLEMAADYAIAGLPAFSCYDIGQNSIDLLEQTAPARQKEWRAKRVKFYRRCYYNPVNSEGKRKVAPKFLELILEDADKGEKTGQWQDAKDCLEEAEIVAAFLKRPEQDKLHKRYLRARHLVTVQRKAEGYLKALQTNPKNSAVRISLLTTLIVDLNKPEEAARYVTTGDIGPVWETYVPLACTPVAELKEAACKELGDWYYKILLKSAKSDYARVHVLVRARNYYERFLDLSIQNEQALATKILLSKILTQLAKLAPEEFTRSTKSALGPQWIDLLTLVDPDKHAVSGRWVKKNEMMGVYPSKLARIALPFSIRSSYELSVVFSPKQDDYDACLILPVGSRTCSMNLGRTSGTDEAGLETIDGKPFRENETKFAGGAFLADKNDVFVRVNIRDATDVDIIVTVNGKEIVSWRGKQSSLSLRPEWNLDKGLCFGLGSNQAAVIFQSVRLRKLGEGKISPAGDPSEPNVVEERPPTSEQKPPVNEVPAPRVEERKLLTLDLGGGVSMELALVPAGEFIMGSPKTETGRAKHEGPQHEVTIGKAFYMGVCEVTQQQYASIMRKNPSKFLGRENPVDQVSWNEAVDFCRKLSQRVGKTVRLPTEAEWEYACRAGSKTRYCFGNSDRYLGSYAWYGGSSGGKTHPVGKKRPNAWGLYDMHGNVWEWCGDWYAESYAGLKTTDPQGPGSGKSRVLRGGTWYNSSQNCRSARRGSALPGSRGHRFSFGFRVALTAGVN